MKYIKINQVMFVMIFIIMIIGTINAVNQPIEVKVLPDISAISPLPDHFYSSKNILVNINYNGENIQYSDNGKNFLQLCINQVNCNQMIYLLDGKHDLTFKMSFKDSEAKFVNINNITIDSKKPVLKNHKPFGEFADGRFTIRFEELNPAILTVSYGNNANNYKTEYIDLNACKAERIDRVCSTNLNLAEYDGQFINYFFKLTDIAGNSAASNPAKIKVDAKLPVINSIVYNTNKKKVIISASESNLEGIYFYDNYEGPRAKWIKICSRLKNAICEHNKRLNSGKHNIIIRVVDKAGNSIEKQATVVV